MNPRLPGLSPVLSSLTQCGALAPGLRGSGAFFSLVAT